MLRFYVRFLCLFMSNRNDTFCLEIYTPLKLVCHNMNAVEWTHIRNFCVTKWWWSRERLNCKNSVTGFIQARRWFTNYGSALYAHSIFFPQIFFWSRRIQSTWRIVWIFEDCVLMCEFNMFAELARAHVHPDVKLPTPKICGWLLLAIARIN